jgi:CRP-like cAMP-binding protein
MPIMNLDSSAFVADEELIQALSVRANVVDCDTDRLLFRQGEASTGLYILHAGEVIITMDSISGCALISFKANPGSLLGLPGLIGNTGYSLSAFAKKGATVSFVSRDDFSSLMLNEPGLSMKILRVLANEVRSARLAITNR